MTETMNRAPCRAPDKSSLCPSGCARSCGADSDSLDDFSRVALSLFRLIGAAYVTGCSHCWEAAHRFADETPSVRDGALLVARVAAIVRILRGGHAGEPVYLPPCCNRLSKDELQLMALLQAARRRALPDPRTVTPTLVGAGQQDETIEAINALAALSDDGPLLRSSVGAAMVLGRRDAALPRV